MNEPRTYKPVQACIYCLSKNYNPIATRKLGDEHIIPEALSGNLILPEASCEQCERKINKWETKLLKGALLPCKTYLKLKTKNPKNRPQRLPLFDTDHQKRFGGKERKVDVEIDDYPILLLLLKFSSPKLLNTSKEQGCFAAPWHYLFTSPNQQTLNQKYNLHEFATSSLDSYALCRTLGKIAHAYAVAELGLHGFVPFLPNFICGNYDNNTFDYIGSKILDPPAGNSLHDISIEYPTPEQWPFVVIQIRLFSKYGAPTYRVIAGLRKHSQKPEHRLSNFMFPIVHGVPQGYYLEPN